MTSLPTDASFVVLSLDPVASVAHLNNRTLTTACEQLPHKKYVAYLGEGCQTFRPWMPYNCWPFYFVFQGLRPANPDEGITPEMSVPILPNKSHPSSRKPMNPGKPLPWKDCYISEFVRVEARCATVLTDQQPEYEASSEEAIRVDRMFCRDLDKQLRLQTRVQPQPVGEISGGAESSDSLVHSTLFDVEHSPEDATSSTNSLSEVSFEGTSEAAENGPQDIDECVEEESDLLLSEVSDGLIDNEMVVVTVSYDLSSVDEVNDPDDFFKELVIFDELRYNLTRLGPRGRIRRRGTTSTTSSRSSKYFGKRVFRFFKGISTRLVTIKQSIEA